MGDANGANSIVSSKQGPRGLLQDTHQRRLRSLTHHARGKVPKTPGILK